jgi:ATP-dependent DNA helicase RecG
MDAEQIKKVLEKPETHDLELKESLHSEQEISKIICAFANTEGGLLVLGADKKGTAVGAGENPDELQQRLSACGQSVSPAPLMDIEAHKIEGKQVILAKVHKADSGSFHTFGGVIYVRMGSTTRRLEGSTMVEFLKNRQILCFDELGGKAAMEDMDENKVRHYLLVCGRDDYLAVHTTKDFFLSLNMASETGAGLRIKNAAVLSFSKAPQSWFPQSEVKVVRFRGTQAVDIVDHQVLDGSPAEIIGKAYAFILRNMRHQVKTLPGTPQAEETYEYPPKVIREAIINAVAHRDYFNINSIQISVFDDRIEFTNPGSIPQGLARELFGTISVQRNPLTYRVLKDMKYVEGYGMGVPRMINGMRSAGLVDPEFFWTDAFFRLTLKNSPGWFLPVEKLEHLNERQRRAIEYLHHNKTMKAKTYATMNKVSVTMALLDIKEMLKFGYIKKVGSFRGAYYVLDEEKSKMKS